MNPATIAAPLTALALLLATIAARADILIGVAGPMSGPFAIFGNQMTEGARQAIIDINAAGGVLGEELILDVADDKCDRGQAELSAQRMVDRQVALIVGHLCSGASVTASAVYNGSKIIQISPGAKAANYTDDRPGPGIFRLAGRRDQQGKIAGQFLATRFADSHIAILHDSSPYGRGLAEATRDAMNQAGKSEIIFEAYPPAEPDFSSLLERFAAESIDVLYFGGYHRQAALILRQMKDENIDVALVSGDALLTEEFMKIAGDAGVGALMTYPPDPAGNAAAAEIVERLTDKDIRAEDYVLHAYAAVESWSAAVETAGTIEHDAVASALAAGTFETALGRVTFDANGDATLPAYIVYEWQTKDGDYIYSPI